MESALTAQLKILAALVIGICVSHGAAGATPENEHVVEEGESFFSIFRRRYCFQEQGGRLRSPIGTEARTHAREIQEHNPQPDGTLIRDTKLAAGTKLVLPRIDGYILAMSDGRGGWTCREPASSRGTLTTGNGEEDAKKSEKVPADQPVEDRSEAQRSEQQEEQGSISRRAETAHARWGRLVLGGGSRFASGGDYPAVAGVLEVAVSPTLTWLRPVEVEVYVVASSEDAAPRIYGNSRAALVQEVHVGGRVLYPSSGWTRWEVQAVGGLACALVWRDVLLARSVDEQFGRGLVGNLGVRGLLWRTRIGAATLDVNLNAMLLGRYVPIDDGTHVTVGVEVGGRVAIVY